MMLPDLKFDAGKAAMAAGDPHEAAECFSAALSLSADPARRILARVHLDEALIESGSMDEADALWAFEDKSAKGDPAVLARFVLGACNAGSFTRALSRLSEIEHILPPPRTWSITHRCLMGLGEAAKATAHIEAAKDNLPPAVYQRGHTAVLLMEHRYKEVLDRVASASNIRSSELLKLQTMALIGTGQYDRVEADLPPLRAYFPTETWIDHEMARNASAAKWGDLALQRWQALALARPTDLAALRGLVEAHVALGDIDGAAQVIDEAEARFRHAPIETLRAMVVRVDGDLPGATAILRDAIAALSGKVGNRPLAELWSELALLRLMEFEITCDRQTLDDYTACARKALALSPDKLIHKTRLVDALIRTGEKAQAMDMIAGLPASNRGEITRLRIWRHAMSDNMPGAVSLWKERKLIHYIPQVHAGGAADLRRQDENALPPKDAVTLYTVLRDERARLSWFFDHYRRLGVENFVVIDNGSTDGSTEFLLSQPGTNVFRTDDIYHAAYSGMVWVNHLKSMLSPFGWALYVDVDEGFVYDGCETHSIPDLAEHLDLAGQEAFTAFMLDMFSTRSLYAPPPEQSVDYATRYAEYLPGITALPNPTCPFVEIRGGLRSLFKTGEELTKTPLIKAARGIDFLHSSHHISPARVSNESGVLLHYKFVDGLADEAKRVLSDQKRSRHCRSRYVKYSEVRDLPNLLGAALGDVRHYQGPRDLVAGGLMPTIDWAGTDD